MVKEGRRRGGEGGGNLLGVVPVPPNGILLHKVNASSLNIDEEMEEGGGGGGARIELKLSFSSSSSSSSSSFSGRRHSLFFSPFPTTRY